MTFVHPASPTLGASGRLCAYDLARHTGTVLFTASPRGEKLDLSSYQWSPRGDAILLEGENDLWLLNPTSGELRQLTSNREEKEVPTFSPTGDRVAFVMKHNLCVLEVKTGAVRQLTHDGNDTIYNGRLDWVYEEELANRSTARAYEWSPDGRRIAYLRLDDGPVPEYTITDFLSTHIRLTHQRFPQAGDPNPLPSLHVVAVDDPYEQPSAGSDSVWRGGGFTPPFGGVDSPLRIQTETLSNALRKGTRGQIRKQTVGPSSARSQPSGVGPGV